VPGSKTMRQSLKRPIKAPISNPHSPALGVILRWNTPRINTAAIAGSISY